MMLKFINNFFIFLSVFVSYTVCQNACEINRLAAVKNGTQKLRGSNLGSWLVLEAWMAPAPWNNNGCSQTTYPGSYLLEKCLGSNASTVMQQHWSTFITENDFIQMSQRGVNVVRIPIGWWQIYDTVGGAANASLNYYIDPRNYTPGGLAYLDNAFTWGKNHGIAILLDMHAAPGSQNGHDTSSPPTNWGGIFWDKYPSNVGQTVDSMELYAKRYANNSALFGFELLNEPMNVNITVLKDYYQRAYTAIRKWSSAYVVISPLSSPVESGTESYWTGFMNPAQNYTKVAMDLHYYSCFGGDADQTNATAAIAYITVNRTQQIATYTSVNPKPMLIGEWSSCGHFSNSYTANFTRAQVTSYNTAGIGWSFWSWTNGNPGNVWSLKTAFNSSWLDPIYPC